MKDNENRSDQKVARVREFATTHAADVRAGSLGAQTFANVLHRRLPPAHNNSPIHLDAARPD